MLLSRLSSIHLLVCAAIAVPAAAASAQEPMLAKGGQAQAAIVATGCQAAPWRTPEPFRVVLEVRAGALPGPHSVVQANLDFGLLAAALGEDTAFSQYSLRVEALDGASAAQPLPFRFEPLFSPRERGYSTAGRLVFTAPDPSATRFAVYFGPEGRDPLKADPAPLIGDGDTLQLAGDGWTTFPVSSCYPCVVDFDGDGRRDLVGSDRWGTGALVTWFRNIGTENDPAFSERETVHLQTVDGQDITNPNGGWLLTVAICDWDGDGKRDLLVGGWCRYLTFHKNIGTNELPAFDAGKVVFDAKVLPGLDYGSSPDTLYQGVFIEPCDWDGDGNLDLLCGTYMRGHVYLLPNTGRDADGLPILGEPVALEAGGKPIDFLVHCRPSARDWDGDGDLDLLCGQYYTTGDVTGSYYFENTGERTRPQLAPAIQLKDAEGVPLMAGFHSQLTVVDWDLDGTPDIIVSGCVGTVLYINEGTPAEPRLVRKEIPIRGYSPCHNSTYPVVVDWDGDGTLDIVAGDTEGNVFYFRGLGGMQYAAPVKVKSEGKDIDEVGCPHTGEAHSGFVKVAIADWNGDNYPDLIMWSHNGFEGWQGGTLGPDNWCLKFFPGTEDPLDFGPPIEIKAAGKHIMAGFRCKPDVVDLDGDGLLDLVVACGHGEQNDDCTLMFFKNVGTKTEWKLAEPVPLLMADGRPLAADVRTAARLVDWDGDGDLDLLTGTLAPEGVRYWENVGTRTEPRFAEPQPMDLVNQRLSSHHEVGVDAVDLDGDGTLDLVVGNGDTGMLHFFRRAFLEGQPVAEVVAAESKEGKTVARERLTEQ